MKESDLQQSFNNFINRHTPDYGIQVTYPNGEVKIDDRFKTVFEAQWWQVNVTNPFAIDSQGNRIRSSLIVKINKRNDA